MFDTFTTLGFQHDLHSTTNVQTVLSKLPTPCRLEWNRYNLQCNIRQPSLIDLTNWFNIYAEACSDLPSNSNNNNNTTRNSSSSSNNYNSSNTQGSSSNGHTHQHGPSDHRANQNNRNQQRSQ
ncbi:GATA zinc finger domain-containing protein 24-like [Symsagittifera roscoffensis]|uniref:GATA zinc finger domain-containing protein 24-like n=1 Tax=Symsagittifera roscoffensis TaxID=84072 RepID=UPI00307B7B8B